jgi:nucleotide-binding universal stress UspA family protein
LTAPCASRPQGFSRGRPHLCGLPTYLLAYDDSDSAKKALRRTIELVTVRDLIVLVWVRPDEEKFTRFGGSGVSEAEMLERMNAAVALVKRESRQAAALLLKGDVAGQILKASETLDADIIILGHRGVSKIGPFALGSVAERVAQAARRKVLIVK